MIMMITTMMMKLLFILFISSIVLAIAFLFCLLTFRPHANSAVYDYDN